MEKRGLLRPMAIAMGLLNFYWLFSWKKGGKMSKIPMKRGVSPKHGIEQGYPVSHEVVMPGLYKSDHWPLRLKHKAKLLRIQK